MQSQRVARPGSHYSDGTPRRRPGHRAEGRPFSPSRHFEMPAYPRRDRRLLGSEEKADGDDQRRPPANGQKQSCPQTYRLSLCTVFMRHPPICFWDGSVFITPYKPFTLPSGSTCEGFAHNINAGMFDPWHLWNPGHFHGRASFLPFAVKCKGLSVFPFQSMRRLPPGAVRHYLSE